MTPLKRSAYNVAVQESPFSWAARAFTAAAVSVWTSIGGLSRSVLGPSAAVSATVGGSGAAAMSVDVSRLPSVSVCPQATSSVTETGQELLRMRRKSRARNDTAASVEATPLTVSTVPPISNRCRTQIPPSANASNSG